MKRTVIMIAAIVSLSGTPAAAQAMLATRPISETVALLDGNLLVNVALQGQLWGPLFYTTLAEFYFTDHFPGGSYLQGCIGPTLCVALFDESDEPLIQSTLYLGAWPGIHYVYSGNNGVYPVAILPLELGVNFTFGLVVGVYLQADLLHLDATPPCVFGVSVGI